MIFNFFLGEVSIPLSFLEDMQIKDQWFTLGVSSKRSKEKVRGDIHLVLQLEFRNRSKTHPSLPLFASNINEQQYHKYFQELVFKLVQIENPNFKDKSQDIHLFSSRFTSLLNEYCLRFGICDHFKNLT